MSATVDARTRADRRRDARSVRCDGATQFAARRSAEREFRDLARSSMMRPLGWPRRRAFVRGRTRGRDEPDAWRRGRAASQRSSSKMSPTTTSSANVGPVHCRAGAQDVVVHAPPQEHRAESRPGIGSSAGADPCVVDVETARVAADARVSHATPETSRSSAAILPADRVRSEFVTMYASRPARDRSISPAPGGTRDAERLGIVVLVEDARQQARRSGHSRARRTGRGCVRDRHHPR